MLNDWLETSVSAVLIVLLALIALVLFPGCAFPTDKAEKDLGLAQAVLLEDTPPTLMRVKLPSGAVEEVPVVLSKGVTIFFSVSNSKLVPQGQEGNQHEKPATIPALCGDLR